VNWPKDKVEVLRKSFFDAAQAFWPVLLKMTSKLGPRYVSYAELEGRRLGLNGMPDNPSIGDKTSGICPPSHWDLSAMDGISSTGSPNVDVAEIALGKAELCKLQELLKASFKKEQVMSSDALAPAGLELVRASRIQNWPTWARYKMRQGTIIEEMERAKQDGASFVPVDNPLAATHLDLLGELDAESNVRWLFHGITAEAAARVHERGFDIDVAGAEDGMLYGRGVYLTEYSSRVDRSVPAGSEGLRCMLLCRVTLGRIHYDEQVLPDKVALVGHCTSGGCHTVLGDRERLCPESSRDFVVYDRNQVYPEYLLWYHRVYR